MTMVDIKVVRVYLAESENLLHPLMTYLHEQLKVRGVTVFRGICGFGTSGKMLTASLMSLSLDLPVVIEFFDTPSQVDQALAYLNTQVKPGHIICWSAQMADAV